MAALAASPRARALLRECGVVFAFALLTAVMTWPWARHWRDAVSDLGDPYTIAYTLWWDYHATFHQPLRLFDATIFYPYRDTLAFSEHDYGIALLFFPLFALGVAPLTVHSLATLAAFVLSGYGAFRLTRTLTGSAGAAWVAGIAFAFVPYRFHRLPHLHYIFAGWIPLLFEALVLFARARTWRRASWLGAAFAMNALTCVTWFVLSLLPLGLCALLLVYWQRAWRDPRLRLRGGLALAAAALVLLPFFLPYRRVAEQHGFVRTAQEVRDFSATLNHWFAASARNKLWAGLGRDVATDEAALFPGLLAPLIALASLLCFATRRAPGQAESGVAGEAGGAGAGVKAADDAARSRWLKVILILLYAGAAVAVVSGLLAAAYGTYRVELFGLQLLKVSHYGRALILAPLALMLRWVLSRTAAFRLLRERGRQAFSRPGPHGQTLLVGLVLVASGFFGSFGMNFFLHRLLFEYVEVFRSIRVPARWAMIAYVGLAVLAGLGAQRLAEFFARRGGRAGRRAVFAALAVGLLGELWAAPLAVVRGVRQPDELTLRLERTEMSGGIVHVPVFGAGADFEFMIRAADHGKPLITATSSFLPPLVVRLHALTQQRPFPAEFLDALEAAPASYLVLDYSSMTPEELAAAAPLVRDALAAGRLCLVRRFADRGMKDLFAVTKIEPAAPCEGEYTPPKPQRKSVAGPAVDSSSLWRLTPEFAEAGPLLHRFYVASYGRAPTLAEFVPDLRTLTHSVELSRDGWQGRLEESAARFAAAWVEREDFRAVYGRMNERKYVNALADRAGAGVLSQQRRELLAAELAAGRETRAGVLLRVVADEEFARRESDAAFVRMHYFDFLERDPDAGGFEAWLKALGTTDRLTFTRIFTSSTEYQNRRRWGQ